MKAYSNLKFRLRVLLFLVILLTPGYYAFSQGCSDAGFCMLPGIKPVDQRTGGDNLFQAGFNFGSGDRETDVTGYTLSYRRFLNQSFDLGMKLNYQRVTGPLGTVSGFSDLFVSSNLKMRSPFIFTAGLKIPLNKSDVRSFPMEYQPSVGTLDLLAGVAYEKNGFGLSFGIQQPLNQNNFSLDSIRSYSRKADLLFRLFYQWDILDHKLTLTPSVLNIYHLGEDTYEFENGTQSDIDGSAGLTLNANFYVTWHVNTNFDIELFFATPFIVREVRPDGLTRSFVAGFELGYRF